MSINLSFIFLACPTVFLDLNPMLICIGFLKYPFGHSFQTEIKIDFKKLTEIFFSSNWIFTACVVYKNPVRTEMEFSYSQTENFVMEKLSSDTGYFKKPVEINRGTAWPGAM